MSCASAITDGLSQSLFTFAMPKALLIENAKLGILHRLLQVFAVAFIGYDLISHRAWQKFAKPTDYGLEVWTVSARDRGLTNLDDTMHCIDPTSLQYTYSELHSYEPDHCRELIDGERIVKANTDLFIPTFLQDDYVSRASGTTACEALEVDCQAKNRTFRTWRRRQEHVDGSGGSSLTAEAEAGVLGCECRLKAEVFVMSPEQEMIHFNHGYEVDFGTSLMRGSSKDIAQQSKSDTGWTDIDNSKQAAELETVIMKEDGTPCAIGKSTPGGAKDVWTIGESGDGVAGTLEEWLECGGMPLDTVSDTLRSNLDAEIGEPRPRIAGAHLYIDLYYYNAGHLKHDRPNKAAVCHAIVRASPRWNAVTGTAYSVVPEPGPSRAGSYRFRTMRGVSVHFHIKGEFSMFDTTVFVTQAVNAIVIMSIPGTLVCFVALYCIGRVSTIYYRAQSQRVNIQDMMRRLTARAITAVSTFRSIAAGGDPDLIEADQVGEIVRCAFKATNLEEGHLPEAVAHACYSENPEERREGIRLHNYLDKFFSMELLELNDLADIIRMKKDGAIHEKLLSDRRLFEHDPDAVMPISVAPDMLFRPGEGNEVMPITVGNEVPPCSDMPNTVGDEVRPCADP